MRPYLRKLARAGAVAVLAPFITCSDFTGPSGRGVHVPVVPTFSEAAVFAKDLYASAGLEFDRVRVIIARGETVLKDTSVAFTPSSAELELPLLITATAGEMVTATLEYRTADLVLYSGTALVRTVPAGSPETVATPIVIAPSGPGADADRVEVSPSLGSFPNTAPLTVVAQAFTVTNSPIANALFGWSVDDETIATVSAIGVVQPTTKGGVVKVRATTLNQKFSEATITFTRAPASLVVQSGGNQTALAQDALAAPVVVKVADVNGLGVPGATVSFAVASGAGSLSAMSAVSDAAGLVSVNWTLGATAGAQSIIATSAALPNAPLTINATATPRPAVALAYLQKPSKAPMKVTIVPSVTIKALNDKGGIVSDFTGAITVALEANPGSATLGGTLTQNAVGGVATFANLTVSAAGVGYTLKATATGLTSVTSPPFTIEQVASTLTLAGGGGQTAVINSLLSPISVKVGDANGVGVAGVTVAFEVVTGGGSIVVENAVTDASGLAKVKWTLGSTVGTQSIKAVAAGLTGSPVVIEAQATALPPTALAFVQQPSNVVMGATMSPAVTVKAVNSNGETVTGFTGAVSIALDANPGSATLGGTVTANAVSGIATFSDLTMSHAGTGYTLKASATGFANVISSPFNVSQVATSLSLTSGGGQSATIQTALAPITVKVADANGVGMPGVTVAFEVVTGSGSVNVASATTDASGLASVTWTLGSLVGTQSIKATVAGLTGSPLTVEATGTALPAVALAFVQGPSNVVTNATMTPAVTVQALNANNAVVTGFTGTITLTLENNTNSATLGGSVSVAAVNGIATFSSLTVNIAGSGYALKATTTGGLNTTSSTFVVADPTPVAVQFQVQPSNVIVDSVITPAIKVKIVDANGVTVPGATNAVTLTKPPMLDAGFNGTFTVNAVNGVATFDDISVYGYIGPFQLTANAGGLTAAVSNTFNVTLPPAVSRVWTGAISTDWNVANNWSPAGVPLAADSVTIPAAATNQPLISGFATANAVVIEVGASMVINSLSGLVTQSVLNRGTLTLTTASISGDVENRGTAIVNGFASVTKWTTTSTGLTRVTSPSFDGAGLVVNTAYINEGQLVLTETVASDAEIIVSDSLVNRTGATITVEQGLGGQRTISGVLRNYGAVNVATSSALYLLQDTTGAVNAGTITFSAGGNLYLYGADSTHTFVNTGTMALGAGVWELLDLNFKSTAGTVTGTGKLHTYYSQVDLDFTKFSRPLHIGPDTRFAGGSIVVPAGTTVKVLFGEFADPVQVAGTLDLTDVSVAGTRLFNGGVSIGSTGSVLSASSVTASDLAIAAGGKLTHTATGAARTFQVLKPFTNLGTIELSSAGSALQSTLQVSGTLTNGSGGLITARNGAGGERRLATTLNNLGSISVEGSTYLTLYKGLATHTNSGSITLLTGTVGAGATPANVRSFTVQGSESAATLQNSGTISIGSFRAVLLDSTYANTLTNQATGTIGGTGTLHVPSVTTFTNAGTLAPGGVGAVGTLTFQGNLSSNGKLAFEIAGLVGTGNYDRLVITGSGFILGTVQLSLLNGFTGTQLTYDVATAGTSMIGDFTFTGPNQFWGGSVDQTARALRVSNVQLFAPPPQ